MTRHSSGQARVRIAGKCYYLGTWGSPESHARYAEIIKRYLDAGRQPFDRVPTVAEATLTVADLFLLHKRWIESTQRYLKDGQPTSSREFYGLVTRSFEDFAGSVLVHRLREATILAWRDELERNPKTTRKGINRKVGALLAILRWGRARGHVPREVWADCSAIVPLQRGECGARPEHGRPRRAPSFEEIEKVAAACSQQIGAMLRLQALTGMRPGEVAKLRWCDIDSNGPTVNGVPTWIYTVHAAKTAHHDHVTRYALPPAAQAILGEFPAVPTAHIFSPAGSMAERRQRLREARQSPPTRQMRDRDARPKPVYAPRWGVHEYRVAVERACRVAGVDRFTPHEVRHAFASWAANALGVMVASVALNHKNLATTQRYLHADPAAAFLAAAEVQKRVGG